METLGIESTDDVMNNIRSKTDSNDESQTYRQHLRNELDSLKMLMISFLKFTRTYRCAKRKFKVLINLKNLYFSTVKSPLSYVLLVPLALFFAWLIMRLFFYNEMYAAIRAQNLKYSIMCENASSGFYTASSEPISSYNFHKYRLNDQLRHYNTTSNQTSGDSCSCKLLGHCMSREPPSEMQVFTKTLEFSQFYELNMYPMKLGGYWKPPRCAPDFDAELNHDVDRVTVIIVPYLNRYDNLKELLYNLHPYLQRQFVNYRMVVVEQSNSDQSFNKGRLYNAAFSFFRSLYSPASSLTSLKLSKYLDYGAIKRSVMSAHDGRDVEFRCMILHDVDLVPENDYNIYECDEHTPRHLSLSIRRNDNLGYYKNLYELLVGGVLTMKPTMYEKINGFSNEYWKWGAEDDDLAFRMLAKGMCIQRPSETVSVYKMSTHNPSQRNPIRIKLLFSTVERMSYDGLTDLNQLGVEIVDVQLYNLFTHIKVDVKEPDPNYHEKYNL